MKRAYELTLACETPSSAEQVSRNTKPNLHSTGGREVSDITSAPMQLIEAYPSRSEGTLGTVRHTYILPGLLLEDGPLSKRVRRMTVVFMLI